MTTTEEVALTLREVLRKALTEEYGDEEWGELGSLRRIEKAVNDHVLRVLDSEDLAKEVGDALIIAARLREKEPRLPASLYAPSRVAINVVKGRFG